MSTTRLVMSQHTIRFRIRPDGRVEEVVEGVLGAGCEQLTERIEASLGTVQQRRSTSEAFQSESRVVVPALPLQQQSS